MSKTVCLLYHRINNWPDYYNMAVTPAHFEEQLVFLKENFLISRFADDWSNVNETSVVITFDDGYEDNFLYAFPMLKKHNIPATIFVSTGNVGNDREFWWDELVHLCMERTRHQDSFKLVDPIFSYEWETRTVEQCLDLANDMRVLLRRESYRTLDDWRRQLLDWAGEDIPKKPINYSINEQQMLEMFQSNIIDIGGHTDKHMSLGKMEYDEQLRDCKESINKIQSVIGKKVDIFSYPFGGRGDYNDYTIDVMKRLGIRKAATTEAGIITNLDPYRIPRITIKDCDLESFKNKVCRLLDE